MDRTDLLNDAFKINGEYLEDLLAGYVLTTDTAVNGGKVYFALMDGKYVKVTPVGNENPTTLAWYEKDGYGYATVKAVGRETLERTLTTKTNTNEGETLLKTSRPNRIIEISYLMTADSLAHLRGKMYQLQAVLNIENAKIIFNDDSTCYYVATPVMSTSINDHWNSLSGTINLVCHDPKKYSIYLKEFTAAVNDDGEMETTIENAGTAPVVIDYEITHNHENGYIGIVSEYGAMQYGDVAESDIAQSDTVIDAKSATAMSYTTLTDNSYFMYRYVLNGTLRQYSGNNRIYLEYNPNNPNSITYWHGGAVKIAIPDWPSTGQQLIKNFKFSCHLWFARTKSDQTGSTAISLTSGTTIVATVEIWHDTAANPHVIFKAGAANSGTKTTKTGNLKLASPGGTVTIEKSGDQVSFAVGSLKWSITVDNYADQNIDTIAIAMTQQKNKGYNKLPWMCLDEIYLRADVADAIIDVPNRYEEGSVFTVDGLMRKPYLDGIPVLEDEATGSQYFDAPAGDTVVQFLYSDFSDPAPTCKARIREAWL